MIRETLAKIGRRLFIINGYHPGRGSLAANHQPGMRDGVMWETEGASLHRRFPGLSSWDAIL